jgi:hypothetical protein
MPSTSTYTSTGGAAGSFVLFVASAPPHNIREPLKIKDKSTAKGREKSRKISKEFSLKQIIRLPPVLYFASFRVFSRLKTEFLEVPINDFMLVFDFSKCP